MVRTAQNRPGAYHEYNMKRWQKIVLGIIVSIFALILIGPFLVPVPLLEGVQAAQTLVDADSKFVSVPLGSDIINVHYKEAGEGDQALVLLHGFGASLFSWREVMEPLAEKYRIVAFDRPAFGLTERPIRETWGTADDWSQGIPYSAETQADLTVRLMDELGIEQAVLVGNSAGGAVSMITALKYPERVRALVLISPAIYSGGPNALAQWFVRTPQMQHVGPLIARQIQEWGLDFARSAWHNPSLITDEIWQGYRAPLQIENWDRALWELTVASRANGLAERLNEITVPVVVITGDDDRIVPTEQSERLAQALSMSALAIIPACGHVAHEECPQPTLDAIQEFLASIE